MFVKKYLVIASVFFAAVQGAGCVKSADAQSSLLPQKAPPQHWSFEGPVGHFDLSAVQRGYAVFAKVCSACHSLKQVHFSDLSQMGLTPEQTIALAESWQIAAGHDEAGHFKFRKGLPDDLLPSPYSSPAAARAANGGAVPPDLSRIGLIHPGGADRIYAMLTSYGEPVGGEKAPRYANPYMIGHITAMPPPLHDNAVSFTDGHPATVQQQAHDVTTFLEWVSEPHRDSKRRLGVGVVLYLCFLIIIFFILKRRIWSHVRK